MKQPLVTIIIPVYKVEKYIDMCMNSILTQTYKNIEIVLVDDGSPDNCPMMCEEYAKSDARIKVIHKENGGLSSARNAGLEIANGDYVSFVDSDDYISPYMIEKMVDIAISYKVEMVSCSINKDILGNIKYVDNCLPQGIYTFDSFLAIKYLLSTRYDCSSCNKLFKREILCNTRFPLGRYNEDVIFCFYLFQKKFNIANTSEAYYYYRTTPEGLTQSFTSKKFDVLINAEEMERYIYDNHLVSYMEDIVVYKNIIFTNLMMTMIKKNVMKEYPIEFSKIKKCVKNNLFQILIGRAYSLKIKFKTPLSLIY